MHSLVFKRLEPKKMEEEIVDEDCKGGLQLFNTEDCEPCRLPSFAATQNGSGPKLVSHNPHSTACSYGIQALINNVHRGYIDDDEVDQSTITEEPSLQQESEIIRQWRRKKELELQERQTESQAKQDRILEKAAVERERFYRERAAQIEAKKRLNREKEMKNHADMELQRKLVEGNLWEAVASLIDLNSDVDAKATNGAGKLPKSPKSAVVELATPKKMEPKKMRDSPKPTKKATDLSRMREILAKLQHQPLVR